MTSTQSVHAADNSFIGKDDQVGLLDLARCGRFWPSSGSFQTTHVYGDEYNATLNFTMTQAQINALRCAAPLLELDFKIQGFTVPSEWDGYWIETNLPGGIHDVATFDYTLNVSTPGVTRIYVDALQPGVQYYAQIGFTRPLYPVGGEPRVSFEWVASQWATTPYEQQFCTYWRPFMGDAECVFGRSRVYLSSGYNNGTMLSFDGFRWWEFSTTTPTSTVPPSSGPEAQPPQPPPPGTRLVCDANGDGLADAVVMFRDSGIAKVALSTGTRFGYPGDWSYRHNVGASTYYCADVNGDGMADLISYYASTRKWYVSPSSGNGFWPSQEWAFDDTTLANPNRVFFADVNNDSRADKIQWFANNGNWYVGTSSGSGFWPSQLWISGHGVGTSDQLIDDFNADGKADAAVHIASNGSWHVALSTNFSFSYPGQWSYAHGAGSTNRLVGDTSGDGRADIAYYSASTTKWYVSASSGSGLWAEQEWSYDGTSYNNTTNQFLADANGDGRADKILFFSNTGNWYVGLSSGNGFWPLGLWIQGHGAGS